MIFGYFFLIFGISDMIYADEVHSNCFQCYWLLPTVIVVHPSIRSSTAHTINRSDASETIKYCVIFISFCLFPPQVMWIPHKLRLNWSRWSEEMTDLITCRAFFNSDEHHKIWKSKGWRAECKWVFHWPLNMNTLEKRINRRNLNCFDFLN